MKGTVESASFALRFDEKMNVTEMRLKGEKYLFQQKSRFSISGEEASIEGVKTSPECIQAHLKTKSAEAELLVKGGERVSIRVSVKANRPIENIEIIFPFPEDMKMIKVEEMPVGDEVPVAANDFKLQSSFVDVGKSYLMFGTRSTKLYFSDSKFIKTEDGLCLSWNWEPKAPFPTEYVTPELYFDVFDSIDEAVQDYERWMEKAFSIKRKENNPFIPDWLHQTRLIILLDMWLPVGHIAHNYQDAMKLIKELREMGVPRDTILYLAGWCWKYDGRYPEYWAAPELGGAEEFRALVDLARDSGYHVMPHFNHQGFDPDLPSFQEFSQYQQIDAYGNKRAHPEPGVQFPSFPIIYMDASADEWREYIVGKIVKPAKEFNLDAIFLDQFNCVPNTLGDLLGGQLQLMKELHQEIPGALFSSELLQHESAIGIAPLSLAEVCGKALSPFPQPADDGGIYEVLPKTYLTKKWLFKELRLAFDYHYLFAWWTGIPAVPGKYLWTAFRYITEVGFEKAFRDSQDLTDELGLIKLIRLNYKEYGIDPLSRKEIEKVL